VKEVHSLNVNTISVSKVKYLLLSVPFLEIEQGKMGVPRKLDS